MPRNSYGLLTLQVCITAISCSYQHCQARLPLNLKVALQGNIKRDPEGNHADFEQQVSCTGRLTYSLYCLSAALQPAMVCSIGTTRLASTCTRSSLGSSHASSRNSSCSWLR